MGQVFRRRWKSGPRGVRRVAWGYTLQIDGKQERRFRQEWSRQDAQEALAKRMFEHDLPQGLPSVEPKTLGQAVTDYIDFKRAKGKRSVEDDERNLKKLVQAFGAETPLAQVTAQRIAEYDRKRACEVSARLGRPISSASVNRELATLRHLLRLANEWGYIEKVPKIRLAKEPEGRLRFLNEAEAARLLEACGHSKNLYLQAIVMVALNTGMRRGEVLGLTWDRVDFSRGVLLLEQTKTGRRREIPMNRAVYDALSGMKGSKTEGFVFQRPVGGAWRTVRTAFERACRAAKVHDFRFHDLRHTCASWLVMRGRSLKEVQEVLGHRSFSMTLRYAHLSPDRLRDAVASLDAVSTKSAHVAVQSDGRHVTTGIPR